MQWLPLQVKSTLISTPDLETWEDYLHRAPNSLKTYSKWKLLEWGVSQIPRMTWFLQRGFLCRSADSLTERDPRKMKWMTGSSWRMRRPPVREKENRRPQTSNAGPIPRRGGAQGLNGFPVPASVLGNERAQEYFTSTAPQSPATPFGKGDIIGTVEMTSHRGTFLLLESCCVWQTLWNGCGDRGGFPGKSNLRRKDKNVWVTIEFRRWSRTRPSNTTVSNGIFDTSPMEKIHF